MINIILTYKLVDIALNTLFDVITTNFTLPTLHVGKLCKSISIMRTSNDGVRYYESFHNCRITDVYHGKYAGKSVSLFTFKNNNGNIIMGCTLYDSIIN